jgi:hypothetical protein
MIGRFSSSFSVTAAAALALALTLVPLPAAAQSKDRTSPTRPTNLRVVSMTPHSVTLAWTPSTDNSGSVSYVVCCAHTNSMTTPKNVSTFTYTKGLEPGRSFTLAIVAFDAAGNYSKYSNSVTFTLPRDTIPPAKPVVAVGDIGPTHATLSWASADDGPLLWFTVYMNGQPVTYVTRNTSGTFLLLQPQTTYTFTVEARDFGGNRSPLSDPVSVTTRATNPNDVTPPTTPTHLGANHWGDLEVDLSWDQSTDDFDPQWIIRYDVHVNGELADIAVGRGRSIVYGVNGANTITVTAIDTAGNRSQPATIELFLP